MPRCNGKLRTFRLKAKLSQNKLARLAELDRDINHYILGNPKQQLRSPFGMDCQWTILSPDGPADVSCRAKRAINLGNDLDGIVQGFLRMYQSEQSRYGQHVKINCKYHKTDS